MSPPEAAEIALLNVCKAFGRTKVIDDLSLSVANNELVVFLGPSGCGKTTLLRMIAGLETIDAGEIWIGGRRVDQLVPSARGVSMVFQDYALYPHMSVRENMSFGLRNFGVPRDQIALRVADAAKILEIESLLDRLPAQLSGGQRQRVAIGRAIVKQPNVFLFDEPLSSLDASLRVRTRIELIDLHRRLGAATVLVTHDQVEAMTLADRIVVMSQQRVEQIGSPMEIYGRPATPFVASFVGTSPMNFAPVGMAASAGEFATVSLAGGLAIQTAVRSSVLPQDTALSIALRAEALRISAPERGDARGTVHCVERLGDRTLIHVRLGEQLRLIASDSGNSPVAVGDTVGLTFDGSAAHLFDAQRGYHAERRGDGRSRY